MIERIGTYKQKKRKEDRHLQTEKTKRRPALTNRKTKRRHLQTEKQKGDRHLQTEKRKEDRHVQTEKRIEHDRKDQHIQTEDRHTVNYMKNYKLKIKLRDMWSDTGMDLICSSCIELKSKGSCIPLNRIPKDMVLKYCTESTITINYDGNFYVCQSCKLSIVKDRHPRRCQKELLGLLNFPNTFFDELEKVCVPYKKQNRDDPEKKYLQLNRLEDFLLKPVIPFIRIAHLPRGRYIQLKGDLIMITANVPDSLTKIISVNQQLVPVALKRKLEYRGHFICEYVDKIKLIKYFYFLKRHNHIFENIELDINIVENFEKKTMDYVEVVDSKNKTNPETPEQMPKIAADILDSDDDEMEEQNLEFEAVLLNNDQLEDVQDPISDEYISRCSISSLIANKYKEDTTSYSIANKLSDSIISFGSSQKEENLRAFPLENHYEEDEIFQSDDESDIEVLEECVKDDDTLNPLVTLKKKSRKRQ